MLTLAAEPVPEFVDLNEFSLEAGVRHRLVNKSPGYCVGDDGSVWSRYGKGKLGITQHWHKLSPTINAKGYKIVSIKYCNRQYTKKVHTLVLEAFIGPAPFGCVARHGRRGQLNNCLYNLCWGTS